MASKPKSSSRKRLSKTSRTHSSSPSTPASRARLRSGREVRTIRSYFPLAFAILLILAGVSLIFWVSLQNGFYVFKPNVENFNPAQSSPIVYERAKPTKITIAKINKTLDVSDGSVENNRWVVSKTGVSYLTTSGEVGRVGNAVIYGHNTQGILGGLWRVQNGDIVEISDDRGRVYKYEIFERKEIKPTQVEILNQTDDSRLTIYTCSGFLDTARFVVVGKLVS